MSLTQYRTSLAHENSSINSACVLHNSEYMITGGNDCKLKIHNMNNINQTIELPLIHTNPINGIDIANHNQWFVSGSKDKIIVYDIIKHEKINQYSTKSTNFISNNNILDCKILSNDLVVSCGENHHLNFYDLRQSGHFPHKWLNIGNDNLNSLDYDGKNLVSLASSNGNIYHLDLRNQQLLSFETRSPIVYLHYFQDKFIYRNIDGDIVIHETMAQNFNQSLKISTGTKVNYKMNCFIDNNFVINTIPGKIQFWDIRRKPRLFDDLPVQSNTQGTILQVYSSDYDHLVATSSDGQIHIWDNLSQYLNKT
jgi:WD40 repeat protein